MKKFIITVLLLMATTLLTAQQVKVLNVNVVNGDQIEVNYKITGLTSYQTIKNISFYVSTDNGKTFTGPLKKIMGDTGGDLRNGEHRMVWMVMQEMPMLEENLIFDIKIEVEKVSKAFMVSLVGNTVTPFGIRIGQMGQMGWYVEGRASMLATQTPAYTYENETITDYDQPGYYRFNGNKGFNAWSAVAGITFQFTRNLFLNTGVGYGVENYMYEIDKFSYEADNKTGTAWTKDADYSYSGFELDAGLIFKYHKLIISGGATTINFSVFNWETGIGLAF